MWTAADPPPRRSVDYLVAGQQPQERSQPVDTSPLNPFTKRLRPYLTDDQNDILVSLPSAEASIDASIWLLGRQKRAGRVLNPARPI